jgi:hypothetical protein
VGPHREKEASYYTIKELWSPVVVHTRVLPGPFNGKIQVENRYLYSNFDNIRFEWKLLSFPGANAAGTGGAVVDKGIVKAPSLQPGEKGWLQLPLPAGNDADALYLSAYDTEGREIASWSWALKHPAEIAEKQIAVSSAAPSTATVVLREDSAQLMVSQDGIQYYFDKTTGWLEKVLSGKKNISLSGGPALAGVEQSLSGFKHYRLDDQYIIEALYDGNSHFTTKWIFQAGRLPELTYRYSMRNPADFMGITFHYPEESITGMKWLGRGPYRVWKNRMKGQQLGVWEKAYNNTVTGQSWNYPEFKGWHAELYWVRLRTTEADFTVYTEQDNIFLEMLQPERPRAARNENTNPPFPKGNIGFMHAISPIGTKFQPAEALGPQGGKNIQLNYTPLSGTLWFDFR